MNLLSVVIITRNEENNIAACISSARQVSNDIVVVDSGSDDDTVEIAREQGARVFSIEWQGYGYSRNYGASEARNNWILALDADERISAELAASINRLEFQSSFQVFKFRRINYLGNKPLNWGTLGFEKVTRIYNREEFDWDLSLVHEKLEPSELAIKMTIDGHLDHFGLKNYEDYNKKSRLYALLSAEKYLFEGRKAGILKRIGSPVFNSLKSYIFQLGFLEGKRGFLVAKTIAWYSWLKYDYLQQMHAEMERQPAALRLAPTE